MGAIEAGSARNGGQMVPERCQPMLRCVQVFSILALRRLLAAVRAGDASEPPFPPFGELLSAPGLHLSRSMRQANGAAWTALEVALAGEELWERAQLVWERGLEASFFGP